MSKEEFFREATQAILNHDRDKAEEVAQRGLAEGLDPVEFITKGFREGIYSDRRSIRQGGDIHAAAHRSSRCYEDSKQNSYRIDARVCPRDER